MSATAGQTRLTNGPERAASKMLGQFARSPILRTIVMIRARRWQEIEDAAWEVADAALSIDGTIGVGLDAIGVLVGRGRNDESDAIYRIGLRAQIRINRSAGQIRDTVDVLVLSTGGTPHVLEFYGGSYVVWQDEALPSGHAEALARNLRQVRPLGVRGRLSSTQSQARGARYGSRANGQDYGGGRWSSRTVPAADGGTWCHGRALWG